MDRTHLRSWDGWETAGSAVLQDPPGPERGLRLVGPHHPMEFADRLYAQEALNPQRRRSNDERTEPYTLQWFLDIENRRHGRHGRWIPRLLEFTKHGGETLLALGNGLGTDWLQYARNGASVLVASVSAVQLALVRRNFDLRGLPARYLHAPATCLPLTSSSIDVVCINGMLDESSDPAAVVQEIFRVLKPGGKVLAVMPARYDIDFWFHLCFPWETWFSHRQVAPTSSQRYSARGLRRLFGQFIEHRVHKRQLCRGDVPHVWRWMPRALLARFMGKALILKAFKPLSAAMTVRTAAA